VERRLRLWLHGLVAGAGPGFALHQRLARRRYRAYLAGKVSELEICGEMVQIYAGLREQELRAAAARLCARVCRAARLRRDGRAGGRAAPGRRRTVGRQLHQQVGGRRGRARVRHSRERVLAAEVRVNQGLITAEIVDVPTDAGKAAALKRVGLDRPDAVFGNSIHDLAMLEIARHAFPVNPSPALIEAAAKNGWGYFRPEAAEGDTAAVGGE
jgi:hypothetical protein